MTTRLTTRGTTRSTTRGTSPAPSFTPSSIANLAVWLDAMDASTVLRDTGSGFVPAANGEAVARWVDKSANAHILAQTTSGSRPLLSTSAGPSGGRCITFDGTDDCLTKIGSVFDYPATVFKVVRLITDTDLRYYFDTRGSGSRIGEFNRTGRINRNSSNLPVTSIALTANTWGVVTSDHSTTEIGFRLNGVSRLSQVQSVTPSGSTGLVLGANNPASPTAFLNFEMAEFVVYGRILNSTEQNQVRNYLKVKYGTP